MIAAVCSAWVPEPTSRFTSGCGNAELGKKIARQAGVVVLAGMHQTVAQAARPAVSRASSARMIGAIFMKFGRAPAMMSISMKVLQWGRPVRCSPG